MIAVMLGLRFGTRYLVGMVVWMGPPKGSGMSRSAQARLTMATKDLEGREGFEPSTPGLKVRACALDPSAPTADSISAVLTAWTDRFLVESSAQA